MKLRSRDRGTAALVESLHEISDLLRSGSSLRQALVRSAGRDGSPLAGVATALGSGQPLVPALREAAAASADRDLPSALAILAVHAQAGGDPLPATRALADRLGRREAAREEARALTTQARLGARAILLLTPAFLGLVALTDPRGAVSWLTEPRVRTALLVGLAMQGLGAVWMNAIVRNAVPSSRRVTRLAALPFVRAFHALFAGRRKPGVELDVAEAADTLALAVDAGLSATAALAEVAPYAPGEFGDALRSAVCAVGMPPHESVGDSVADMGSDAPHRFVRALEASAALGAPLSEAMRALADDIRERVSLRTAEDVRRASIRVLVPLGVLVLPAFVLACLVPLFVGGLEGIAG